MKLNDFRFMFAEYYACVMKLKDLQFMFDKSLYLCDMFMIL